MALAVPQQADPLAPFLAPTAIVDAEHPEVREFAEKNAPAGASDLERAVRLYYAVRDGIRYDPYTVAATAEGLRASTTLRVGRGWCVGKAVLLTASCRALGVPARLGFADVRNHLSTARMRAHMQTDVFFWHGYTAILLEGRWVKATPAFNVELCHKFRLLPLEFDGREDSIYHAFDADGNRHMEYLRERGEFADLPLDAMLATFREHYDHIDGLGGDFDAEVDAETSA